ncbi:3908_t:CDS:2 [Entrophospora sp. SA101]|nr:3908_t:CDS:2 [Entrophospora sp. SA101]
MKIVNGKDDFDQGSSLDRWKDKRKINIQEFHIPDSHSTLKKRKKIM